MYKACNKWGEKFLSCMPLHTSIFMCLYVYTHVDGYLCDTMQKSSAFYFCSIKMISVCFPVALFSWSLGFKLKSSSLHSKYFSYLDLVQHQILHFFISLNNMIEWHTRMRNISWDDLLIPHLRRSISECLTLQNP